jgi:hypothetical protein
MFEHTGNVFAAYGLKRAGMANLGDMQKITGLEFVPAKKVDKLFLSGKILNAASIVAFYRAQHQSMRSGK